MEVKLNETKDDPNKYIFYWWNLEKNKANRKFSRRNANVHFDITRWKSGKTINRDFIRNMVNDFSNECNMYCKLFMYCYISPSSECLFKYLNESYTLLYVNKYVLRLSSWIFLWEKRKCQFPVILWYHKCHFHMYYVHDIILHIFYIEALPCQHFLYLLCLAKQFPYLSHHRKNNKIINIHWPIQAANLQPSNNQAPSKLKN